MLELPDKFLQGSCLPTRSNQEHDDQEVKEDEQDHIGVPVAHLLLMSQERKSLVALLVVVSLGSIFAPSIDAAYSAPLSKNQGRRILAFTLPSRFLFPAPHPAQISQCRAWQQRPLAQASVPAEFFSSPRTLISTFQSQAASRRDVNQIIFNQCILVNQNDRFLRVAKILNVEDGSITEAEASVFGSPDALKRGKGKFNASNESAFVKNLQEQIIMPFLTANQASTLA